ncbi:hypothetical protein [Rhodococcoides fascians]|uniref:hypothetical protein n=1 Tax=Rhodococcoides fascians TaxID=1828 RepID=UPI0005660B23|nr:hypothetical protein [Rhodococcus fascians]
MSVARRRTDDVLVLVVKVAAATEDADHSQKTALQALVPQFAALRETKDPDKIADLDRQIHRIMGPTWQPQGQWATATRDAHTIINNGITARGHDPAQLFAPPK